MSMFTGCMTSTVAFAADCVARQLFVNDYGTIPQTINADILFTHRNAFFAKYFPKNATALYTPVYIDVGAGITSLLTVQRINIFDPAPISQFLRSNRNFRAHIEHLKTKMTLPVAKQKTGCAFLIRSNKYYDDISANAEKYNVVKPKLLQSDRVTQTVEKVKRIQEKYRDRHEMFNMWSAKLHEAILRSTLRKRFSNKAYDEYDDNDDNHMDITDTYWNKLLSRHEQFVQKFEYDVRLHKFNVSAFYSINTGRDAPIIDIDLIRKPILLRKPKTPCLRLITLKSSDVNLSFWEITDWSRNIAIAHPINGDCTRNSGDRKTFAIRDNPKYREVAIPKSFAEIMRNLQ